MPGPETQLGGTGRCLSVRQDWEEKLSSGEETGLQTQSDFAFLSGIW